ncbi:hypothetical protein BLA60_39505 [Actinophytocola xinjiangensis]|uniref:Uncharacterized protein n=1 Tax=Actinophytocola xinjiangensis TaxID=485602 RepID=A0A7Z0WG89_9PSEU|nr:hypothetical protein [Actinophytocola xinjiangensis]OLF04710.1 hypothetical protein BLA60_39505 [Actinophytocola xinjiangensis]
MAAKKTETLTTKQIAEALGTTPRELRVFLRASSDYQGVGSGKRYAFETKDVGPMKTRFETWRKERDEAKAAAKEAAAKVEEPAPADDDEVEEITEAEEAPKPQARRATTRKTAAA